MCMGERIVVTNFTCSVAIGLNMNICYRAISSGLVFVIFAFQGICPFSFGYKT